MSVDLFCYVKGIPSASDMTLKRLKEDRPDFFDQKFLISAPRAASELHREIAAEFGVVPDTLFLVHLNDKEFAHELPSVARALELAYGPENILILLENETRV